MRKYNPEIRIVYQEASEAALLLTEAMIRRSSGKRTVETEIEEKEYNGEALFGNALACRTSTGVDLTLRLNPDAMDYALTTLIAKNLTEEEKHAIRMETDSMEIVDLLSPAQAAEAPGQALDGSSSADVPSAEREAETQSGEQEEKIEVGKISEKDLRNILTDMIVSMDEGTETADAIDTAIAEVKERAGEQEEVEVGNMEADKPETDQNLTRLLAVLLYATQDPDWDKEDISNFADVVFFAANGSRGRFVDIDTLCELIAEAEYIATELKSNATTHAILERLESQEGAATPRSSKHPDARRQTAQALAGLIYWTPRNISNKKQRDSIQYACSRIWALLERYPAASILAREIVCSLHHIYTEISNGYKPSDCIDCIEREITGRWSGPIPDFEADKILLFSDLTDAGNKDGEIESGPLDDIDTEDSKE